MKLVVALHRLQTPFVFSLLYMVKVLIYYQLASSMHASFRICTEHVMAWISNISSLLCSARLQLYMEMRHSCVNIIMKVAILFSLWAILTTFFSSSTFSRCNCFPVLFYVFILLCSLCINQLLLLLLLLLRSNKF